MFSSKIRVFESDFNSARAAKVGLAC